MKNLSCQTNAMDIAPLGTIAQLKAQVRQLRNRLASSKKSNNLLRRKLEKAKSDISKHSNPFETSLLGKEQMDFFGSQCRASVLPKKSMRWSVTQKRNATALYLRSPSAYRLMSKKFRLPHKDTLLKAIRPIFQEVSINSSHILSYKMHDC
jgi:hypothetical protein